MRTGLTLVAAATLALAAATPTTAAVTPSVTAPVLAPTDAVAPAGGNTASGATDVSCVSAAYCVAVGGYAVAGPGDELGRIDAQVYLGNTWTPEALPLPGNIDASNPNDSIAAVSCWAVGSCVAVGRYNVAVTGGGDTQDGLVETLSGGSWAVTAPSDSPSLEFTAVSCAADGTCMAAGTSGPDGVVAVPGDGWAPEAPTSTAKDLDAVSCAAGGFCMAVGGGDCVDQNGCESFQGDAVVILAGGSLDTTKAPLPPNSTSASDVSLDSVSCPSAASCTVVGLYGASLGDNELGLLDRYSSGSWTAAAAPEPGNADNVFAAGLASVSCPAVAICTAVGYYPVGPADYPDLIVSLKDGRWKATTPAAPPHSAAKYNDWVNAGVITGLTAVSCPSATRCGISGAYADADGTTEDGELLLGSGANWTTLEAPLPTGDSVGNGTSLGQVSCVSSRCAGSGVDAHGGLLELSDTLTSTALTATSPTVLVGRNVRFTATVTPPVTAGTVTFTADGSPIAGCTGLAVALSTATCRTAFAIAGHDTVVATYSGSGTDAGSVSAPLAEVVSPAPTTAGLSYSVGHGTVTLTAKVRPVPDAGTVAFALAGSTVSTCSAVALTATGQATCQVARATSGTQQFTAAYSGDANYRASTSPVVTAP